MKLLPRILRSGAACVMALAGCATAGKPPPGVEAPGVEAPHVEAPHVEAPHVEAPHVEAPRAAVPAPVIGRSAMVEKKTPIQAYVEVLAAISVRARFPEYTTLDSGNLSKVAEALGRVETPEYVHATGKLRERIIWTPASGHFDTGRQFSFIWPNESAEPWPQGATGLARYGARLWPMFFAVDGGGAIVQQSLRGYRHYLWAGAPGVVWEASSTPLKAYVVFVTLDGGRYEINLWDNDLASGGAPLAPGLGPERSWPSPMAHEILDLNVIALLAKAGVVPVKVWSALAELDATYVECASDSWAGKGGMVGGAPSPAMADSDDAIAAARRIEAIEAKAARECAAPAAAYDTALAALIEARGAERRAIYAKAMLRAQLLGATE